MLQRVLILPSAVPASPGDLVEWGVFKILLEQVAINGVLIVDSQNRIWKEIRNRIRAHAPAEVEPTLQELMMTLVKPEYKRRLVHPEWTVAVEPGEWNSAGVIEVFSDVSPIRVNCLVTGPNWTARPTGKSTFESGCPIDGSVTLSGLALDGLYERMHASEYFIGETDRRAIKEEVFEPVFRDAARLDIYDQYIGKDWDNSHQIKYNYKEGLIELIDILCESTHSTDDLAINIYTYVDPTMEDAVRGLANDLAIRAKGKRVHRPGEGETVIVTTVHRKRGARQDARHNRYLGTEQVVIAIDKGADVIQPRRAFGSDFVIVKDRQKFNSVVNTGWFEFLVMESRAHARVL